MESGKFWRESLLYKPGQEEAYFTRLAGEKFSSCPATTQPMRSQHHPELLLSSNYLLLITAPPNFLLLLYKITFPSFVLGICLWFPIVGMSRIEILLLFLNKLIFCWWNNWLFFFEIDRGMKRNRIFGDCCWTVVFPVTNSLWSLSHLSQLFCYLYQRLKKIFNNQYFGHWPIEWFIVVPNINTSLAAWWGSLGSPEGGPGQL